MPHIDARSGEVVIRIVYDGAPEAGKTTNVRALQDLISLQRRGAAGSPGTAGARTEFFDWLDFSGGYLDGRRVRCQLVSVPGQSRLLHRRRYLLEAADAIVFVTDSRPDTLQDSLHNVSTTVRIAERLAGEVPVGVIVQANKQDLVGALAPAEVLRSLGLAAATPVIGSVASAGAGVMDTFILAVRMATDRVRSLLLKADVGDLPTAEETPDGLHAAMLEREPPPEVVVEAPEAAAAETAAPDTAVVEPEPADSEPPTPRLAPGSHRERPNGLARLEDVTLPQAQEISSGHVWPPVKGRAAFAAAMGGGLGVPAALRAWAPADALEVESDAGWVLHSTSRWVFATEGPARMHLLTLVRRLLPESALLPEPRSLAVARDGDGWRLWLLSPRLPSLHEQAVDAVEQGRAAVLADFLAQTIGGFHRLRSAGLSGGASPAGATGLALQDGRLVRLVLDEADAEPAPEACQPLAELSAALAYLTRDRAPLRDWFDSEGRQWLAREAE